MKVAMYYSNSDVRIEKLPELEIKPNELLVKIKASGICGSDVMEWYRLKNAPKVLGHEIAGVIEKIGDEVHSYSLGDRVFVSHHVPCDECHYCLDDHHTACETLHQTNYYPGGFSEYIKVPSINIKKGIYPIPDDVSFEEGTFIEPLACVVRGQRLAQIKEGCSVLIIGCGVSGLLHIMLARSRGASKIFAIDINQFRLDKATEFGADISVNADEGIDKIIKQNNDGRLADKVIVCAGALTACQQALENVERGGTILYFAVPEPGVDLPLPLNELWRNEMTLMTSYGAAPKDLEESLQLISQKKINVSKLISHRLPIDQAGLGFKLVSEAKECLKVILIP